MTGLRTLPIRVFPTAGEALDSWLETLAFRLHMSAGDLLRSVGLTRSAKRKTATGHRKSWMIQLKLAEAEAVAYVTGVPAQQVMAMTLSAYDGRALLIDPKSGEVNRHRLWGRNAGSRYCPHCLAETGGRWNLSWRLGWSFACLYHQCLLADACPRCNRIPRQHVISGIGVRHPAHCGYAIGRTGRARCGTDLREAVTFCFTDGHPVLTAQQALEETIAAGQASFGVYAQQPVPSQYALADVKAIAARALAHRNADALAGRLPADLRGACRQAQAVVPIRPGAQPNFASPGRMAPSQAAITAAGVVAAIDVLGRPSPGEARDTLRWLTLAARARGQTVNPSTATHWGLATSPVLPSLILGSIQPNLRQSQQLRYRVTDDWPGVPGDPAGRLDALAHGTPALFWPRWALRLAPPGVSARCRRAVLAALLLMPGTMATEQETASILGGVTDGLTTCRVLQILAAHPQWRQILTALIRLADYLAAHPAPIDYRRRRALDYSGLLPGGEWEQLCRATGATPGHGYKIHVARAYMYQRLSGLPWDIPPAAVKAVGPAFRLDVALFPARLFPELASGLDAAGQRFLASQGVGGEPVIWQPPPGLIGDLDLPGTDPAGIPSDDVHQLIYSGKTVSKAAKALGVSPDVLLTVLAEDPAPARPIVYGQGALPGPRTQAPEIPWNELKQLYLRERLSTRQLGDRYDVDRKFIARCLREHGIIPGRRPPAGLTADWLRQEYAGKGRSLDDLATELGLSTSAVTRWAHKYGIPLRPRGGRPRPPSGGDAHARR
jgi:hypothetical protein